MFTIQTLNAISPVGLAKLPKNLFEVAVETDAPDGILVRSADLLNADFQDNLLAIARAGTLRLPAISMPTTSSATALALAPGVLKTTMPCSLHRSRGMLLTPAPARAVASRLS